MAALYIWEVVCAKNVLVLKIKMTLKNKSSFFIFTYKQILTTKIKISPAQEETKLTISLLTQ
jgi:hypothetical protein